MRIICGGLCAMAWLLEVSYLLFLKIRIKQTPISTSVTNLDVQPFANIWLMISFASLCFCIYIIFSKKQNWETIVLLCAALFFIVWIGFGGWRWDLVEWYKLKYMLAIKFNAQSGFIIRDIFMPALFTTSAFISAYSLMSNDKEPGRRQTWPKG